MSKLLSGCRFEECETGVYLEDSELLVASFVVSVGQNYRHHPKAIVRMVNGDLYLVDKPATYDEVVALIGSV